jgi:hypothetical protein
MSVGRSHIGATINTLFLAYVGAGLPLLVVLIVSQQPTALVLNDEEIATEIVRTLVGSIGIIAAVPLTTLIAVLLASASEPQAADGVADARDTRPIAVAAIGGLIAILLAATTLLPLTAGSTTPLTPPVFDPGASFLAGSPQPGTSGSAGPAGSAAPDEPTLADKGQPLPLTVDGQQAGTATVLKWAITPSAGTSNKEQIRVTLRYEAASAFDPDSGEWELLLADGTELPLEPSGATGLGGPLAAGETRTIAVEGDYPKSDETPFIAYVAGGVILYAIPVE